MRTQAYSTNMRKRTGRNENEEDDEDENSKHEGSKRIRFGEELDRRVGLLVLQIEFYSEDIYASCVSKVAAAIRSTGNVATVIAMRTEDAVISKYVYVAIGRTSCHYESPENLCIAIERNDVSCKKLCEGGLEPTRVDYICKSHAKDNADGIAKMVSREYTNENLPITICNAEHHKNKGVQNNRHFGRFCIVVRRKSLFRGFTASFM